MLCEPQFISGCCFCTIAQLPIPASFISLAWVPSSPIPARLASLLPIGRSPNSSRFQIFRVLYAIEFGSGLAFCRVTSIPSASLSVDLITTTSAIYRVPLQFLFVMALIKHTSLSIQLLSVQLTVSATGGQMPLAIPETPCSVIGRIYLQKNMLRVLGLKRLGNWPRCAGGAPRKAR